MFTGANLPFSCIHANGLFRFFPFLPLILPLKLANIAKVSKDYLIKLFEKCLKYAFQSGKFWKELER